MSILLLHWCMYHDNSVLLKIEILFLLYLVMVICFFTYFTCDGIVTRLLLLLTFHFYVLHPFYT